MNVVEKIIAAHCDQDTVTSGEIVEVKPDFVMANDATASLAIDIFYHDLGARRIFDREKTALFMDHYTPSSSIEAADTHNRMRRFAAEQKLKHVYDGKGVCHQLMMEKHVGPGQLIIGADSHTCTYGALGALATGMGSTDIAVAWQNGKTWLKVPESIKINVVGSWPAHVGAKDLILKIIGDLTTAGATYKALVFTGPAIETLDLAGRMTLCNMVVEAGAKCAYIQPDEKTAAWLRNFDRTEYPLVTDDPDAHYEKHYFWDVTDLSPQIAFPHSVDNVCDINDFIGLKVDEIFLGACTNGRYEDLEIAAALLKGRKIANSVRFLVSPASQDIFLRAMASGLITTLVESGAMIANPGCSACFGGSGGILGAGERLLTTANRNFRGRVGDADSEIYLASPAVAAASAITGSISDPRRRAI